MIPLPVVWLLIGVMLIMLEFVSMGGTAFIAEAAGFMAIIIAGIAFFIPQVPLQISIWFGLSLMAIWYSRRFIPKGQPLDLENEEGRTTTEIPPGQSGRVQYEGQSWRAISADPNLTIPPDTEVIIMAKKGTTLVVMPKNWLIRSGTLDQSAPK